MDDTDSFGDRLGTCLDRISPAEQRVARYFQANREEVLMASAAALAEQAGTSDATVVRTAKALGYSGMDEMRRSLARELRDDLSLAERVARTLGEVGDDLDAALSVTLDIHFRSLEELRRDIQPEQFRRAVQSIAGARRVHIFGIGPSSAMANYFALRLGRFGLDARSLTQTGPLLADGLHKIKKGDLVIMFAYGHVYRELSVLLDHADRCSAAKILFSDSLDEKLRPRVDLTLHVARGRTDMLSMHTATLALIEALLVGVAAERPGETIDSLEALNEVRTALT